MGNLFEKKVSVIQTAEGFGWSHGSWVLSLKMTLRRRGYCSFVLFADKTVSINFGLSRFVFDRGVAMNMWCAFGRTFI